MPGCRYVSYKLLAEGYMETGFTSLQSSMEYPAYGSEDQTRRPGGHSGLRNVRAVKEQSEQRCRTLAPLEWHFAIRQLSFQALR